ncbi:hypothetical protein FACS189450_09490 [Spirochaetia bacterium]|nr:hypothetical protein FACS189450_09490 [Spirochaetia bacterium]
MFLDTFKKDIIDNIIAASEGGAVHNKLKPYFRAFTGTFTPGTSFTFYFEAVNKPVMFVYDPTPIAHRSGRAEFAAQCEKIKAEILPISNFIQELADEGYITVNPVDLRDRPALPPEYADYWRKYQHFYSDVTAGLSFVCFSRFRPNQELYDVRGKVNADRLVG